MVLETARLIVDTRNAIAGEHRHVLKLGAPAPAVFRPNAPDRADAGSTVESMGVLNAAAPDDAVA